MASDCWILRHHLIYLHCLVHLYPTSILKRYSLSVIFRQTDSITNRMKIRAVKPRSSGSMIKARLFNERVGVVGVEGLCHRKHIRGELGLRGDCLLRNGKPKRRNHDQGGGTDFHATKDRDRFESTMPIDHPMVTASQQLHWPLYLSIVESPATFHPLTLSQSDLKVSYTPFLFSELKIQARIVASTVIHNGIFSFAAFYGIRAMNQRHGLVFGWYRASRGWIRRRAKSNLRQFYVHVAEKQSSLPKVVLYRVRCQGESEGILWKRVER